jgi:hypothetical protein
LKGCDVTSVAKCSGLTLRHAIKKCLLNVVYVVLGEIDAS